MTDIEATPQQLRRARVAGLYAAGVAVPAALTVVVLALLPSGGAHHAPAAPTAPTSGWQVDHVLLVVAAFIALGHLGGAAAARLGQPRVIGQTIAGLLLGPSLLGSLAPQLQQWLRGDGAGQAVDLLSQLGVVLFVFVIARDLAVTEHRAGPAALVVGHTMVAVPLAAGTATALLLLPERPATVGPVPYVLFLGVAMSATALPVLGHILAERRRLSSPVGVLATTAAAAGDVTLWCLLAVALSLAGATSMTATLWKFGLAVGFLLLLWFGLRPLLRLLLPPGRDSIYTGPAILLSGLLAAAVVTDRLSLHAIFGAFIFGLVLPSGSVLVKRVTVAVEQASQWLLLPLFFTAVGARTRLDRIGDARTLAIGGLVLVVAITAKVLSGGVAGRVIGLGRRDSAVLGVLMNCRGMTELVVLNAGLTAGIIDTTTFTVFVVMAIVTTAATGPLLDRLRWSGPTSARKEPARALTHQAAGEGGTSEAGT
jgi:Kef-type K+ transport system membrane component KefB